MAHLALARPPTPPIAPPPILPAALAARVRTGCIHDHQPRETYPILVMRSWPRRLPRWVAREWWPVLAPSARLLHAPREQGEPMTWECFVGRYLAELDALPNSVALAYMLRLGLLLRRHHSVTLLAQGQVRAGDGGEASVRCQRHGLRAWLIGHGHSLGIAPIT